jgi:dTDP-4-amino-4,6-dideoxygalactose transaminase
MTVTDRVAESILRLPIHADLSDVEVARVGAAVYDGLAQL